MFISQLRSLKEPVITDENWMMICPPQDIIIDGEVKSRGRIPRDYEKVPFGSTDYLKPFDVPIIPRSEWTDRVEEMERTKSRLSDICDFHQLKSLNQNGTNYCWANGPTTGLHIIRAAQGLPNILFSPASIAAPIKGFRNVGGWGGEAVEWMVKNGICTQDLWPANAIDRKYYTNDAKANAARHKVLEWYELKNRNFDQLFTCLLMRLPVAVGYNWWSHEVCAVDPVVVSPGKYGVRIRNSWGDSYGDHGFAVLTESKATPDDAVAVVTTIPTND